MSRAHLFVLVVVVAAFVVASSGVCAQAGKAAPAKGVKIAQAAGGGQSREERIAAARAAWAERLKAVGATDADIEAIRAFMGQKMQALRELMQKRAALRQATEATATDEQAKAAVADFLEAAKVATQQVEDLEKQLKTDIALDTKPKLHAFLLSIGTLSSGIPGGMRFGFGGPRGGPRRGGGGAGR